MLPAVDSAAKSHRKVSMMERCAYGCIDAKRVYGVRGNVNGSIDQRVAIDEVWRSQ